MAVYKSPSISDLIYKPILLFYKGFHRFSADIQRDLSIERIPIYQDNAFSFRIVQSGCTELHTLGRRDINVNE